MKRKLLSLALALVMAAGLAPTAWAAPIADELYTLTADHTAATIDLAPSQNVTIDGQGQYKLTQNITLAGNNTLTIRDLTMEWASIVVTGPGNTLIIEGVNEVIARSSDPYASVHVAASAELVIRGAGSLKARSNSMCAGIGCGPESAAGKITILDGTITATGGYGGAGIGGGFLSHGGQITIHGGTVTATGGISSAGIGGGLEGNGGQITIHGGTIAATGNFGGAGIGGGLRGNGGQITILGGAVTATGSEIGAGIGGGGGGGKYAGNGGQITILGGAVTATGKQGGAGIGGGGGYIGGNGGQITIQGGTVRASSGGSGAYGGGTAIGGGGSTAENPGGEAGSITIRPGAILLSLTPDTTPSATGNGAYIGSGGAGENYYRGPRDGVNLTLVLPYATKITDTTIQLGILTLLDGKLNDPSHTVTWEHSSKPGVWSGNATGRTPTLTGLDRHTPYAIRATVTGPTGKTTSEILYVTLVDTPTKSSSSGADGNMITIRLGEDGR